MNILFLIFNRPDTQVESFQRIRLAKPKRLFIAADGPRPGKTADVELCERARQIVNDVDWDCEVNTLFRDRNLGCRTAVSEAISWFFDSVEEGIVIEDDCVANNSFFRYAREMLVEYRDTPEVMCVSGNNFQDRKHRLSTSYYFSAFPHCWGWATWRDSWLKYESEFKNYDKSYLKGTFFDEFSGSQQYYWNMLFAGVSAGEIDSWAIIWTYSCWLNNGLTALPKCNLVRNVGFGIDATHTKSDRGWASESDELEFPLKHCGRYARDQAADDYTSNKIFKLPLLARVKRFFKL